jgi:hypothetical protein
MEVRMPASSSQFEDLARKVEAQATLSGQLAAEVADAINAFMSTQSDTPLQAASDAVTAADFGSTHQILHLVDRVTPGWTIVLRGKALEPDGHWTCSLRPSESRDDAEVIGHAQGPELSKTLVVALLHVLAYLTRKS